MLKAFESNLIEQDLLEKGDKVVLGVSGGPDSMAMLDLFLRIREEWRLSLFVVHVNHLFRGIHAVRDAQTVEAFCADNAIAFYRFDYPVEVLSKEWGMSFEEAGRKVRYESFEKVRREVDANRIAVAQNRNDQAETILMRIMRGTGIDGLKGVPMKRGQFIIRPVLFLSRDAIETYCAQRALPICRDHTNDETIYTRNKIRHELIPYIEENFNERIMEGLYRLGVLVSKDMDYIETSLDRVLDEMGIDLTLQTPIPLADFNGLHEALKSRVLRRILKELTGLKDVTSKQVDEVIALVDAGRHGKKKIVSGVLFRIEYACLKYERMDARDPAMEEKLSMHALEKKEMSIESYKGYTLQSDEVAVDLEKIDGKLNVRYREDGDVFHPLGMKGTKKIKKFFIDLKIPAIERDEIPLLCDGSGIIWVVGYRLSERVKVDEKTRCVGIFKWSDSC